MASNSVIITNGSALFKNHNYLNPYSVEFESSDSSSSVTYSDLSSVSSQMDISNPSSGYASFSTINSGPYLTIQGELKDQLRFRYKSEKGNHGGLKPIVKLHNYDDSRNVFIKASLYATNEEIPHVYELDGKQCVDGVCWLKLKDSLAKFPSLSISTKKKDEIINILKTRKKMKLKELKMKIDEKIIEKEALEEIKLLNLNSGRLCFEAYLHKKELISERIFSHPIYNQKSTVAGDLKITLLSSCSGKASGGTLIVLLCDKVRKDDIEVCFYEEDCNGRIIWEAKGVFSPADVHHQVAIPFKTPPFRENEERDVYIKLIRMSDGKSGEPVKFTYIPDDDVSHRLYKRKRPNLPEDSIVYHPPPTPSTTTDNDEGVESSMSCMLVKNPPVTQYCGNLNVDTGMTDLSMDLSDIFNSESLLDVNSILRNLFPDSYNLDANEMGEQLHMEATFDDLASLTLSAAEVENGTLPKLSPNTCERTRQIQELKNGITSILKNRGNDSFLNFLPVLLTIKDEASNNLLHLTIIEKSGNLLLLVKMLEVAPKHLVNQANSFKMTPLHLAVSEGLWKNVRVLLHFGADPNLKNLDGNNCFHLAVKYNYSWCLHEILSLSSHKKKKHNVRTNVLNYEGLAPLHIAVMNDSYKCTEALIRAKAVVNIADGKCGKTPLHIAYERNSEIIELLISHPDIECVVDSKGFVTTSRSPKSNEKSKLTNTKITECSVEVQLVEALKRSKDNANTATGKCRKTLLHIAYDRNSKIIELLLSQPDIDKSAMDFKGSMPASRSPKSNDMHKVTTTKPTECCIEPDIKKSAMDFKGSMPSSRSPKSNDVHKVLIAKPTECCIEMSSGSNNSIKDGESIKEKLQSIDKETESKLCELLDSNNLWKQLGIYVMDENELNIIAEIDSTPTKTILKEFKKRYGENYSTKLEDTLLSDSQLKYIVKRLETTVIIN